MPYSTARRHITHVLRSRPFQIHHRSPLVVSWKDSLQSVRSKRLSSRRIDSRKGVPWLKLRVKLRILASGGVDTRNYSLIPWIILSTQDLSSFHSPEVSRGRPEKAAKTWECSFRKRVDITCVENDERMFNPFHPLSGVRAKKKSNCLSSRHQKRFLQTSESLLEHRAGDWGPILTHFSLRLKWNG